MNEELDDIIYEDERPKKSAAQEILDDLLESGGQRYCCCAELVVNRKRIPCPKYHDCSYVEQRSQLIRDAVKIANEKVPILSQADEDAGRSTILWTWIFASTMDRLAKPLYTPPQR